MDPITTAQVAAAGAGLAKVGEKAVVDAYNGALGTDHSSVARDLNNLGLVLHDLGELQGARVALERALRIDEAALGTDHPAMAIRLNNLASVLQHLGDLQGARAAYERAVDILEAALGPNHPNTQVVRKNLATLESKA